MSIEFISTNPKRIEEADGRQSEYKFVTHEIHSTKGGGLGSDGQLFLVTDYEGEDPSLYAFRLTEGDVLVPIDDALAEEISQWISTISLPEFPTLQEIKELLDNE